MLLAHDKKTIISRRLAATTAFKIPEPSAGLRDVGLGLTARAVPTSAGSEPQLHVFETQFIPTEHGARSVHCGLTSSFVLQTSMSQATNRASMLVQSDGVPHAK
jgi:hypothetical protein